MASVADLKARREEIRAELKDIDADHTGEAFDEDTRGRWNGLNEELEELNVTIEELDARHERLADLADSPDHAEAEPVFKTNRGQRVASRVPDDPTNLEEYRNRVSNLPDLEQAYRDGAMQILERSYTPAHPGATKEEAQDQIGRMLDSLDLAQAEDGPRSLARRIIATSSRGYAKEFATYMRTQGRVVGKEMERAASLTTTAGGFAVPVELDTSLILASAGVIDPIRQIARVRTTVVNTVEFINTTGITAAFGAEAAAASDNAPVLAQPTVNVEKAFAFVPMSIEIAEDWSGIQQDLAVAFQDAKNTLESAKFLKGLGHTAQQPQGLIAAGGATAIVSTATTAVFAVADLYSLENALSPRFQKNASIVGHRAAFQKVRQFDTAGGANLWVQLQNSNPPTLLGYPAHVWSDYASTTTTSGSTILTIGDFSNFAIVDRVGMSVEFIPHLFGASQGNLPTGQRGLYMYWRTSSQVLTPTLQANSAFVSLKVL